MMKLCRSSLQMVINNIDTSSALHQMELTHEKKGVRDSAFSNLTKALLVSENT